MGTTYSLQVILDPPLNRLQLEQQQNSIRSQAELILQKVNRQMSLFKADSELSQFNAYSGNDWFPVSAATAFVFEHAIKISRWSGGAFDITVAPLVALWGFGPAPHLQKKPAAEKIAAALTHIGFDKIQVRPNPPALKKLDAKTKCDLAAIAKGFAVDELSGFLQQSGYSDFLVEIGGEVHARGKNRQRQPWRVGIDSPQNPGKRIRRMVGLSDQSLATSGDYRNYFEIAGIRFSHTIDPATGTPIAHSLASISVVSSTCMDADARATALNVLGPEQGWELAEKENIPALFIIRTEAGFLEKATPAFAALVVQREIKVDCRLKKK